jgi:hypothetical protein
LRNVVHTNSDDWKCGAVRAMQVMTMIKKLPIDRTTIVQG